MAAELIHEAAGKMTHLCRKMVRVNIRWRIVERVSIFRDFFRFIWERFLACSAGRPAAARYRRLHRRASDASGGGGVEFVGLTALEGPMAEEMTTCYGERRETDQYSEDLVSLKISLLGDCQIGKTSFVIKYVGDEQEKKCLQMKGLNLMDKTLSVQGAKILCSIWDVGGDQTSLDHLPIACKDAVAILFMFDLTSRCTLNSVIGWYSEARKWNQTAIPILVGTKFDDFVRLPPDLQWTIITQARAYAKAMKATLFFSSATHNINVNKIFKFILAKLFNLPWTIKRNLTVGEPIIDF